MAYVSREYDDQELIDRLLERNTDLKFGNRYVEVDEVEMIMGNAKPTVVLKVHVPMSEEDVKYVLANPVK